MFYRKLVSSQRSLLLVFLVTFFGPFIVRAADDVPNLFEDAMVRSKAEDCAGAIVQLKAALQLDETHLPARVLLGSCQLELDDAAGAERSLLAARNLGADNALLAVPLAQAYLRLRKYEEVLSELSPSDLPATKLRAELLVLMARAHVGLREYDKAMHKFRFAVELAPAYAPGYVGQARIHMTRGELDAAQASLGSALRATSVSAEVWTVAGELARRLARPEAARGHFDRALEIDPQAAEARIARAALRLDAGMLELALEDVESLRADDPLNPQAAFLHALVFEQLGDDDSAKAAMAIAEAAIEQFPDDELSSYPTVLLLRGVIHFRQDNFEKALAALNRFLIHDPSHLNARRLLGLVYLSRNDAGNALAVLEPIAARADKEILRTLSEAYFQSGQFALAEQSFAKFVAISPDDAAARVRLNQARFSLGHHDGPLIAMAKLFGEHTNLDVGFPLGSMQTAAGRAEDSLETVSVLIDQGEVTAALYDLQGRAFLQLDQLTDAKNAFTAALQLDGQYKPALLNWAKVEHRQGNLEIATTLYTEMWESEDQPVQSALGLASLAFDRNAVDEANVWLEKAQSAAVPDDLALLTIAHAYLQIREISTACEIGTALESQHPQHAEVLDFVGQCARSHGDINAAKRAFANMARYAGNSISILRRAGQNQFEIGDVDAARLSWKTGLRNDPDNIFLLRDLALLEGTSGNMDRALHFIEQIRETHGNERLAAIITADLHAHGGDFASAETEYQRAHDAKPTHASAIGLYRTKWVRRRYDEAIAVLTGWLDEHPDTIAVRNELAMSYVSLGRTALAISEYEELMQHSPRDVSVLNNLAWLYLEVGDERAVTLARSAHELQPTHWGALDTLGWILVQNGEVEAGLGFLRDARTRASESPEVAYHLAAALHALGRSSEAMRYLEEAVNSTASFSDAAAARQLHEELVAR